MVKNHKVTIAKLNLLAQEYLAQPSTRKRTRLERQMSEYANANPSVDLKQLMRLRLYLFQKSKDLDETLQF
ncbi:MAG: hypothetical protein K9K86_05415 [Pseudomonadales bacterium]|nr:hypothetical protein [Pseudomonadales bacterium]